MAEKFFVNRAAGPKEEPIIAADPNTDMDMATSAPISSDDDGDTLLVGQYLDVQA
jgi:hypothetical protein